jgi:FKBP-type peptidyl-prolyl cis-trans isomerase SlyD
VVAWRQRRQIGYGRAVKIEHGRRVRLKVHLAVVGGETLEKSVVEYIHGGGTMLPGLEKVLQGLEAGAKKDGVLKAKDAFGNPAMHPSKKMKRTEFPKDAKLKLGERFMAKAPDGKTDVVLAIEKLAGDDVEVRLVHPLAEKDLRYECEVVSVTDPKPPPLPAKALKLEDS